MIVKSGITFRVHDLNGRLFLVSKSQIITEITYVEELFLCCYLEEF